MKEPRMRLRKVSVVIVGGDFEGIEEWKRPGNGLREVGDIIPVRVFELETSNLAGLSGQETSFVFRSMVANDYIQCGCLRTVEEGFQIRVALGGK